MYPPEIDYRRADSVAEAADLLATYVDGDAAIVAGGHSLVPDLKAGDASPDVLIDVAGIDALRGVTVEDGETVVGATTTYADALESDRLHESAGVLADAIAQVGDLQVRNRGTVGGNLANAASDADLPAAALAAEATMTLVGPDGQRSVEADDFFLGPGTSAVRDDEILTGIRVPDHGDAGGAYAKKTHPASGYAMVGVAATVRIESGVVVDASVGATGVTDRASRLRTVEAALTDEPPTEDVIDAAADRAREDVATDRLASDVHASGEFRVQLLGAFTRRALTRAVGDASGG